MIGEYEFAISALQGKEYLIGGQKHPSHLQFLERVMLTH